MLTEKQFLADLLEGIEDLEPYLVTNKDFFKKDLYKYRSYFLNDPQWAYKYARLVDEKPRDDTRKVACGESKWAFCYAVWVDEATRDDTRKAACGEPQWAYAYAGRADKTPRDDTRKAACGEPQWAYFYARDVDRKPRDDTFNAVIGSTHEEAYIKNLGKPKC